MPPINPNPNGGYRAITSATYPIQVIGDSGNVTRCGPMVSPKDLRDTYLFGIPLTSPLTKQSMNDETLKVYINRAINQAELETGLTIVETVRLSRQPFDKKQLDYFWYMEIPFRPITAINDWSVVSSDNQILYTVPPPLIETENAHLGQLSIGFSTSPVSSPFLVDGQMSNNAYVLLQNLAVYNFPGYWSTQVVCGFKLDSIPSPINQLISVIAAIDILNILTSLRINTSSGLSIDGLGQNTSTLGPNWLLARIESLTEKKNLLVEQIRSYYYNQIMASNW